MLSGALQKDDYYIGLGGFLAKKPLTIQFGQYFRNFGATHAAGSKWSADPAGFSPVAPIQTIDRNELILYILR
jgi:hypothetical protein